MTKNNNKMNRTPLPNTDDLLTTPIKEEFDSLKIPSSNLNQKLSRTVTQNPSKWDKYGGKITFNEKETEKGTETEIKLIDEGYIVSIASTKINSLLKTHPDAGIMLDYMNSLALSGQWYDKKNYLLSIDANDIRELKGSKAKNNDDIRKQIKLSLTYIMQLNLLDNSYLNSPTNGKEIKRKSTIPAVLKPFGGTLLPGKNKILVGLNPVYVNQILYKSHFILVPKILYRNDVSEIEREIYKKLSYHYEINKGRSNERCIKLSSLIDAVPNNPTLEEIAITDRAYFRRLIEPCITALDNLVDKKVLLAWDFCSSKQQPLKEEELLAIDPESATYNWETLYNQLIYFYFPKETEELENFDSRHDLEDKNLN